MKRILLIVIFISLFIPSIYAQGYGEDSDALGQFVDDYENLDNVTVIDDLVRNTDLDAIELNGTPYNYFIDDQVQLREHDIYVSYEPVNTWSLSASYLRFDTTAGALGDGYAFLNFNASWLDGKYIRVYWFTVGSYPASDPMYFRVYDGHYERNNDTQFPEDANILLQGAGLLYSYREPDYNAWRTRDFLIDLTGWGSQLDEVMVAIYLHDNQGGYWYRIYIQWMEINGGSGGASNIITIDYNNTMNIVMEVTGTDHDQGYVNNTQTLPYESGGYSLNGYFITDDYLNYTDGNALSLLVNTTIPVGEITVQFSNDNSTWLDNKGNVGSTNIEAGFYSIDLRELNYTEIYSLYSMVGDVGDIGQTPRLYQSRLVTTWANVTGGVPGDAIIQNVTGVWEYHNISSISTLVGTLDSGNLASTLDIDGNAYNVSETVGNPAFVISFNWTNIDSDASCLWVVLNEYYDGNQAHDIHLELYNFSSTSWIEIGIIEDGATYEWVNASIYNLRIPNDFVNASGAVLGRIIHDEPGNINHDISIEYLKLYAFIPSGVSITGGINSATILMLILLCALAGLIYIGVKKK